MGKKEADFNDASRETMAVEDRQRYLDQRLIDITTNMPTKMLQQ